jgi:hypothetical protein
VIPVRTVAERRLLVGGLWVGATTLATAVSFVGVSMVTASVIRPVTPAVAQEAPVLPTPTVETVPFPPPTTIAPPPPAAPAAAAPTVRATTSTTAAPPPAPSFPFRVRGGVATVTCAVSAIRLASASPDDGYTLKVSESGPTRVDLAFVRDREVNRLTLACQNGTAVRVPSDGGGPRPTEPPRHDGRGGGGPGSGQPDGGRSGPGGGGSYPQR